MAFRVPVLGAWIALIWSPPVMGQEWADLFDGKSLAGWVQRGGEALYHVENGAIVGTTVPGTPNSFLCTEMDYGDFVLELEFQVDERLNSGVQVRSSSLPGYREGRVHGYQVDIDPSDRGWTGGIYDESRRGWLNSLQGNRAARYAFRPGQWNSMRVMAVGDSIRTWINGVAAADLVDAMTQRGFIALQVHGVGDAEEALQVRWRRIRLQNLGASRWIPLFNTTDLSGWSVPEAGDWTVKEGILHGVSSADEKRHSMLLNETPYGDFTMRIVYRAHTGNSGFYFRSEKTDDAYGAIGLQAEIDAAGRNAGGLYEIGGRKWVVQPSEELTEKIFGPGEWNEMTVSAHGRRIVVHLNGTKTAEVKNDPGRLEGLIGLQLHASQDMDIEFRSVERLDTRAKRPVEEPASSGEVPVIPEGAEIVKLADGFRFTEGPAHGPDGRIYFSDIPNERIHSFDPATGVTEIFRESSGRANGLAWTPAGALIACEGGNRRLTRTDANGEVTVLAETFKGANLNSPNDLALDGEGGIYFSDPRYGKDRSDMEMEIEGVYYLPRRGELQRVADDLAKPNGIILSPDERILYVADPGAKTIWAYDIEGPGVLAGKRAFAAVGSDGMTVDERGNVYCTFEKEVWTFSPEGEEVGRISPPEGPANVTFGGADGKTLYMTARTGLYAIELNVRGN